MSAKGPTIYPGVDTIRQVQELLVLASALPADGELARALRMALDLPAGTVTDRMLPVADVHPHTMKGWLEQIWLAGTPSPAQRRIVEFQSDSPSMATAVAELRRFQGVAGIRLVAEKV